MAAHKRVIEWHSECEFEAEMDGFTADEFLTSTGKRPGGPGSGEIEFDEMDFDDAMMSYGGL